MIIKYYNRILALFAAVTLVISLGACKNSSDTMDNGTEAIEPADDNQATEPTEPTEPTGGGPDDLTGATEGSGTTTSDPAADPSANEPVDDNEAIDDSTDPTGGGPADLDTPESSDPDNIQPELEPNAPDDNIQPGADPNDPDYPNQYEDEPLNDPNEELPNEQLYDSDNSNTPGAGSSLD